MGVVQTRILSLLFIVTIFLASYSLAALNIPIIPTIPPGSGACCVPYYEGSLEFPLGDVASVQSECDSREMIFVQNCYQNRELIDPATANSGCCCNGNVPTTSTSFNLYVSQLRCEQLSEIYPNYSYKSEAASCEAVCNTDSNYYSVSGIVTNTITNEPLNGMNIRADGKSASTNNQGQFVFTLPFEEGGYEFEVYPPANYQLDCEEDYRVTRTVGDNVVDGTVFLSFPITCSAPTAPEDICEANFNVSEWSECVYLPGEPIGQKTREVIDLQTDCDYVGEIPARYSSEGCDATESFSGCDGTRQGSEVCDGDEFFYNNQQTSSLDCSTVLGEEYKGSVSCSASCTLDISECNTCDCTTFDQCDNECEPICGARDICESCDEALKFIPKGAPSSGDIFDLYRYIEDSDESDFVDSPVLFELGTNDVTLRWNFIGDQTCQTDVLGYDIFICEEGANPNSCITVQTITPDKTFHEFEDVLKEDTSFCFNVIARTANGGKISAFADNEIPCYETGASECMNQLQEGSNCVLKSGEGDLAVYGPTQCETYSIRDSRVNLKLEDSDACAENQVCIETAYVPESTNVAEQGAMCVQAQLCDSCNGIFGLFAGYNLYATSSLGDLSYRCEELLFSTEQNAILPGFNGDSVAQGQCYKEESSTLFSAYQECEVVTSCYDYVSQATCSSDPCFKFSRVTSENGVIQSVDPTSGCEWLEIKSEFGLGVCRPVEEQNQNCEICDTNSSLGFCGKDVCPLYGDCYQKEADNYKEAAFEIKEREDQMPACLNVDDMSCALYDTQIECIGEDLLNVIKPTVDVIYSQSSIATDIEGRLLPTDRIAGTNTQLTFSNDKFGFGDCAWNNTQQQCYKNSNNYADRLSEDDCDESDRASINCYKDNETPITTINLKPEAIPFYGTSELFDISFTVQDEHSSPAEIQTYVSFLNQECIIAGNVPCMEVGGTGNCLSSSSPLSEIQAAYAAGCYIYPQYNLTDLKENRDILDDMLGNDGGEHQLIYFSEDKARNLEELQMKLIRIDSSSPEVVINEPVLSSKALYNDFYRTDVDISVDVYEESNCQASLVTITGEEQEPVEPGLIVFRATPPGDSTPYTYDFYFPQLVDGEYEFSVSCSDDFQNENTPESKTFTINADGSITPVSPIKEIFFGTNEIELVIETADIGTCKYDIDTHRYNDSRGDFNAPSAQEDGYIHRAIFDYDEFGSDSKVYAVLVSCDFGYDVNGDRRLTQSIPGDSLLFIIDDLAPEGNIYDNNQNVYSGSTNPWQNERTLELTCDDANTFTPTGYNRGCSTIHYCVTEKRSLNTFNQVDIPQTECAAQNDKYFKEESGNENDESISTSITLKVEDAYNYIHYFFEDRGGKQSRVYTINPKIRDTGINDPIVEIG